MTKSINSGLWWFESSLVSNSEASIFSHKSVKTVSEEHLQFGKLYTLWVNHRQRFSSVFPVCLEDIEPLLFIYITPASPVPPHHHHHHVLPWNTHPAGLEVFSLILCWFISGKAEIMILLSKLDLGRLQSVNNIAERRRLQWQ